MKQAICDNVKPISISTGNLHDIWLTWPAERQHVHENENDENVHQFLANGWPDITCACCFKAASWRNLFFCTNRINLKKLRLS